MPLDGSILGNCASEQMEALEHDFGDRDDIQIGGVITIVELQKVEGTDPLGNVQVSSTIRMRHNVGDPFRVLGLLDQVKHDILAT
ncbi:MAG TPA: hypothetical protein VIH92_12190 [Solirubrobacteraceae bacterium]|jgi:hypothetical protein